MIEKITDQNLERYDSRLKEWCDKKFFEKGSYGKYETTEEAGVVAFYPAPNIPLEGKVKFSFKETMPAEGDKGPKNPSTITGVSSVNIKRFNKNCMVLYPAINHANALQFTKNADGSIKIFGEVSSPLSEDYINLCGLQGSSQGQNSLELFKKEIEYTASFESTDSRLRLQLYSHSSAGYSVMKTIIPGSSATFIIPANADWCWFRIHSDTGIYDSTCKVQIELGSQTTKFELPAIVNSYDISFGDTYYGGEIDLATGLMTVSSQKLVIDENCSFSLSNALSTENLAAIIIAIPSIPFQSGTFVTQKCSCNKLAIRAISNKESIYLASPTQNFSYKQIRVYLLWTSLGIPSTATSQEVKDAALAWFTANPVELVVTYSKPYSTVQLSPTQILSLIQTDKYTPRLNTVYTDADSVQISYLKSPIRDEYEKTQAILSLGGNS